MLSIWPIYLHKWPNILQISKYEVTKTISMEVLFNQIASYLHVKSKKRLQRSFQKKIFFRILYKWLFTKTKDKQFWCYKHNINVFGIPFIGKIKSGWTKLLLKWFWKCGMLFLVTYWVLCSWSIGQIEKAVYYQMMLDWAKAYPSKLSNALAHI